MNRKSEQQRLNEALAYELDKYQVILEYGRVKLAVSNEIRKKYRWITDCPKIVLIIGILGDIGSAIIGAIHSLDILIILAIVLTCLLLAYFIIRFSIRNDLAIVMEKEESEKLTKLLDNLNAYISRLSRWIEDVDSHITAKKADITRIQSELRTEKNKQESELNEISAIYGHLNPEWEERARDFANKRLDQFNRFIYVQESESTQ